MFLSFRYPIIIMLGSFTGMEGSAGVIEVMIVDLKEDSRYQTLWKKQDGIVGFGWSRKLVPDELALDEGVHGKEEE
jgi:hypothetical protein